MLITSKENKIEYRMGFIAALLVSVEVGLFGLLMAASLIFPQADLSNLSYLVGFLLAPTFITMMTAIFYYASDEKKIWAHLGLIFSIIYSIMVLIVYYLQLVVVRSNSMNVSLEVLRPFIFTPGTAFFAVDMLGYGFMAFATLFAAFAFNKSSIEVWIKRLFIFHGLFAVPTLVVQVFFTYQGTSGSQGDIFGSLALLFWSIIFVPSTILVAVLFRNLSKSKST